VRQARHARRSELGFHRFRTGRQSPRRVYSWRWWTLLLVSLVTALAVGVVVMTTALFVLPPGDTPERAQAVVVLGGSGHRVAEGLRLVESGVAPNLVVSDAGLPRCPRAPAGITVACFTPSPFTTQGEARFIGADARRKGWKRIVVVAGTPQLTRARIRIGRCYRGEALYVGVSPGGLGSWLTNIVHEWGALAEALVLQTSC
jgi:hypothetical protein